MTAAAGVNVVPPEAPAAAGSMDPALLSSLAHELRNPLAPLVNALFLLRAKVGRDADATWALDIVDRQVSDLRLLLDDTSDIARLLRGRLPRPTERVSADELAEAAARAARPELSARSQTIVVTASASTTAATGDRARLVRALRALLVYTGRAAVHSATITLAVDSADAHFVTFVVAAPAQGAPASAPAPASFEAGIGVAFADAVARWHDGSLVQRADGEGRTRCELRVPRHRGSVRA